MDMLPVLDSTSLMTLLVFVVTFVVVYLATERQRGTPPGPALLPVIGNLHVMAVGDLLKNLQRLRETYGDTFSLYIGNELTIFLNGYKTIQEALVKKAGLFSGRIMSDFHSVCVKRPGIVFGNGKHWKEQRGIAIQTLRDFCVKDNGQALNKLLQVEMKRLVAKLEEQNDGAFDIESYITVSVCNVICGIMYNKSYELDDTEIQEQLAEITAGAKIFMMATVLCNCFPFIQKLPFDLVNAKRIERGGVTLRSFFKRSTVDRIKHARKMAASTMTNDGASETSDPGPDSFVDRYAKQMLTQDGTGGTTSVTEDQLPYTMLDLFGAGTETTANTIRWILLHLVCKPSIQEKIYQEISAKIGDRQPMLADRAALPYTWAVVLEGLRIAPAVPLAIPHTVARDTIFRGNHFPRHCSVMVNINSALKDPAVWSDPESFIPERFLDATETEIIVPKEFIPFSLGPRSCIGGMLSKNEIFLYVATLVRTFRFLPECDGYFPDKRGYLGVSWSPTSFKLRLAKR